MRQLGHGASLDAGRLPGSFFDYYVALQRYTDTMRNDGAKIADVVAHRAEVTLTDELLGAIPTPTLFLWGADDTFGDEAVARGVAEAMPDARLQMIPAAGHLPWLDYPSDAASWTTTFLAGERTAPSEVGFGQPPKAKGHQPAMAGDPPGALPGDALLA